MRKLLIRTILLIFTTLYSCVQSEKAATEVLEKIEMDLSAFGVETEGYPSIDANMDFLKDTSYCVKSYYNPAFKGSTYALSKTEMTEVLNLLKISTLKQLKSDYTVQKTDQPSSKIVIYTNKSIYKITDYGLEGESPLPELYKIVYKF